MDFLGKPGQARTVAPGGETGIQGLLGSGQMWDHCRVFTWQKGQGSGLQCHLQDRQRGPTGRVTGGPATFWVTQCIAAPHVHGGYGHRARPLIPIRIESDEMLRVRTRNRRSLQFFVLIFWPANARVRKDWWPAFNSGKGGCPGRRLILAPWQKR